MLYAGVFVAVLIVLSFFFLVPRKVTRLKKLKYRNFPDNIFQKINREIAIFNKMKIVLPSTKGLPNLYIKWLGRLHVNPYERANSADPIEKLMYLYAACVLFGKTSDEFRKRQYFKDILYAFGTKKVVNKVIAFGLKPLKISNRKLFAIRQPMFKFLQTKFVVREENLRFANSYAIKTVGAAQIKNYVGTIHGTKYSVECFEVDGKYRFTHDFASDKFKSTFSHTSDTFYCTFRNKAVAVVVQGQPRVNFETNLADKDPNLLLFINVKERAKIFVLESDTKVNVMRLISKLKGTDGKVDYLQAPEQIAQTREIEELAEKAYLSRFVTGEKLKNRQLAAQRLVPTIHIPTLVFDVTDGGELFAAIDFFGHFRAMAAAGMNINVVILYSSQNDVVREFIGAFTSRREAAELVAAGVFLFFIDKIKASNDAVYYLSKMANLSAVHAHAHSQTDLSTGTVIVSRKNVSYSLTNPRTGITKYYRLTPGSQVADEFGRIINVGFDAVCTAVHIVTPKTKKDAAVPHAV